MICILYGSCQSSFPNIDAIWMSEGDIESFLFVQMYKIEGIPLSAGHLVLVHHQSF